jgi:hypothetical protein
MRSSARHHPAHRTLVIAASTLLFLTSSVLARAAELTLMPSPQTVHVGHFATNVKPVLSINSGNIVAIETAAWSPSRSSARASCRQVRSRNICATSIATLCAAARAEARNDSTIKMLGVFDVADSDSGQRQVST